MDKMVDGKIVAMTAAEIAAHRAREAAFEAEKANPLPRPKSDAERIAELDARVAALERKP